MDEIRSNAKPKHYTCSRCNSSVQAVHTGSGQDSEGRRIEIWTPGECVNPQCSARSRRLA
ncbi:hypothetical protein [Kitasatospora purpeofusca]|uniref:hypothetical protein n=1 Tax=Kitasatospora purpeofusca TaxID=67352 RepID=UPI003868FA9A|nr:hypothetical protein OIP63_37245 [Kitasatospora purpeofusca]